MKPKPFISIYSLLLVACGVAVATDVANAGVRVGNLSRSYADSHAQVNDLRMGTANGQQNAAANTQMVQTGLTSDNAGVTTGVDSTGNVVDLPVRVANADLAKRIALGETVGGVGMAKLESCARIYPDGEFSWDTPAVGVARGGAQTCVAKVELHVVNGDSKGNDIIVASANLAAGDTIKCNISDFPESSYAQEAGNIEFPADAAPTKEDVIRVMNEEQKKNAGIKIAAGAVIGAIGGNIAGKQERGAEGILGTGKDKMKTSAIGALSGAAIMAGNSYAGKVGGDVILSTGVNAAAGGVIGNMMASGNSVLRIEECDIEGVKKSCLWGVLISSEAFVLGQSEDGKPVISAFYNIGNGSTIVCETPADAASGEISNCKPMDLVESSIKIEGFDSNTLSDVKQAVSRGGGDVFKYEKQTDKMVSGRVSDANEQYVRISSANKPTGQNIPVLVPDVADKTFGFTAADWDKWRASHQNAKIYQRDYSGKGTPLNLGENVKVSIDDVKPLTIDAEDGGIIDISNKARLKSTMTGAGIGGAMGGFVGYQGAQSDIDERWVSESQQYKDSLTRFYCATGKRYLSAYNDVIVLPQLPE